MTDVEKFTAWARTHTAFVRLTETELKQAFERAAEAGFAVVKKGK